MNDLEFDNRINRLASILEDKGYEYLGQGSSRSVYQSPNQKWVVKLPIDLSEAICNIVEYKYYKVGAFPMARCRLVVVMDIPLIFMEYVTGAFDWLYDPIEEWRHFDGGQYGYNRKGEAVLYDMGWDVGDENGDPLWSGVELYSVCHQLAYVY